jgi:hypothetical protein
MTFAYRSSCYFILWRNLKKVGTATIPPISVVQKIRPYAEVVDLPINQISNLIIYFNF